MKKKQVIIFGTGRGGILMKRMLEGLGCEVIGFVDNAAAKQGTQVEGLMVYAPDSLLGMVCEIVIASVWEKEIYVQLEEMGLDDRIVGKEEYAFSYLKGTIDDYSYIKEYIVDHTKPITYIFGLDYGFYDGGVESWAYTIGDGMKEKNIPFKFLSTKETPDAPGRFREDTYYLDIFGKNYIKGVQDVIRVLLENAPCVVVDSWQNVTMLATSIVKSQNSNVVLRNIEVLHNDLPRLYQAVQRFEPYIDSCMGVSKDINKKLIEEYKMTSRKVTYKESPVKFGEQDRVYHINKEQCLRIGYAARLTRVQKRADLLIPLAKYLMELNVNFHLQIAGMGDLFELLKREVVDNGLQDKVDLMGYIPREQMNMFWNEQDVFINLSEYEGVGLSMLEAMGNGCVPVVTRVAGSEEFVERNMGYICEQGDVESMAQVIKHLSDNRELLFILGQQAKVVTRGRCSIDAYIKKMLEMGEVV